MKTFNKIILIFIFLMTFVSCKENDRLINDYSVIMKSIYKQKLNIPKNKFDIQVIMNILGEDSSIYPTYGIFDFRLIGNKQITIRKYSGDSIFKKNNSSYFEFEFTRNYLINNNFQHCRTLIGVLRDSVKFYEYGFHCFYIIWKNNPSKINKQINWYPDSSTEFIISNLSLKELKDNFPELKSKYYIFKIKKIEIFSKYSTLIQDFYDNMQFLDSNGNALFK